MTKGSTVFYSSGAGTVRAAIQTIHRDGSATVEAKFWHEAGKDYRATSASNTGSTGPTSD